jgi:hypothetical protein
VVTVGVAETGLPVEADNEALGLHEYPEPPVTVSVVGTPPHTNGDDVGETLIGNGVTVTFTVVVVVINPSLTFTTNTSLPE